MRCYFTPGIKARTWIYGKINTFHNVSIPNENYVILLFCSYFHPKNNNFHRHRKFNIIILYKIILRLATLQDFLIKKTPHLFCLVLAIIIWQRNQRHDYYCEDRAELLFLSEIIIILQLEFSNRTAVKWVRCWRHGIKH